ncbi:lycopene cyclase domain-containing protein [Microbacterium ginsengiterrae]|uniref:Lycopene cyclase domain-containing protein n=1 Tax=Microbacterium ginsengiterrae TaxID=546115 RepID=A0A7W9CC36_9MICO|nr:lycopene cyclase domain-containing protein [Microbacterium paludicola]MBB5742788.1 lycopene cyclase domain-containing protein [Microbacterium ginsengiterrae]
MSGVYAAALLVSTGCLVLLDVRFRLVFRRRPLVAAIALVIGLAFFIVWDAAGIALGVFRHVDSRWASGILLAPEFPIEELLFLAFLCYLTLILLSGWRRWREVRSPR